MIQLEHVSLSFREQRVLNDLTVQIGRNELVGISGKSGCGKSTLLKALLGFVPVSAGRILIDGTELTEATVPDLRRKTAYLPQDLNFPVENVRDLVQLPFELKTNRNLHFSEEELFGLWDILGLEHKLYGRKVHKVSGGQRQRILLSVMAMLHKPLCLIDEPASGLDTETSERVMVLLQMLRSKGSTLVVVSHDPDFFPKCDQTISL